MNGKWQLGKTLVEFVEDARVAVRFVADRDEQLIEFRPKIRVCARRFPARRVQGAEYKAAGDDHFFIERARKVEPRALAVENEDDARPPRREAREQRAAGRRRRRSSSRQ